MAKQQEVKGLKRLRGAHQKGGPQYHCDNCKCNRYVQCGCKKSEKAK